LSFVEEEGFTKWEHILVMATTLVTPNLTEIFDLIFILFGTSDERSLDNISIDSKYFVDLFHYLAARYDSITEKLGNSISEYLMTKR
jgi:hypothetical protein